MRERILRMVTGWHEELKIKCASCEKGKTRRRKEEEDKGEIDVGSGRLGESLCVCLSPSC